MEEEVYDFIRLFNADVISSDDLADVFQSYLEATSARNTPRSFRARFGQFDLEGMDDEDVLLSFRFARRDLYELKRLLQIPNEFVERKEDGSVSHRIPGMTALCITLRRLAYPNRLSDLCPMFGYSRSTLSDVARGMTRDINQRKGHLLDDLGHLQWLTRDRLETYAQAVADHGSPLTNCWAFIDGTARQICRPTWNQELYYSGHKRFHCVKYQSILTPDGIVVSLKGPYHGRRHDAGIWRHSGMTKQLRQVCQMGNMGDYYVLYGDPAYPISNNLITTYPTNSTLRHAAIFNRSMATVRQAVEWGFAKTVREFAFVDFARNQKLLLQDVSGQYKLATLLANCHTCLYGSQVSMYFDVYPPTLEQYLGSV